MKHVVSVSLGSSQRDFAHEVEFLGERVLVERIGVDGDLEKWSEKFTELDGKVDALGIGGADLYIFAGKRRYTIRDVARAVAGAKQTPIVDGSGLKDSLERETVKYVQANGIVDFSQSKTFITSVADRFGLGEEIAALGGRVIFGDLMFVLGLPIPVRRLRTMRAIVRLLAPIIVRLPFTWLYPTGKSQEATKPKHGKYYRWADVIAGDFHYIKRHMPESLEGKTIISNTTREKDVEALRERGLVRLVTSTPEIGGISPGTNVFEAIIVALSDKPHRELTPEDYMAKVKEMGWKPNIVELAASGGGD